MLWIPVKTSLFRHYKTLRAAALLEVRPPEIVGLLVALWAWAAENARDGCLEGYTDAEIASAAGWHANPSDLIAALEGCGRAGGAGFLERDPDRGLVIHHWRATPNDVGKHVAKAEDDVKRTQAWRTQKQGKGSVMNNERITYAQLSSPLISSDSEREEELEGVRGRDETVMHNVPVAADGRMVADVLACYHEKISPHRVTNPVALVRACLAVVGEARVYAAIQNLSKGRGPAPEGPRPLADWFFADAERVREYSNAGPRR